MFLGCLHLVGGPYSLLQGYAWANMLVSYSQTDGLVQAAKDTFSGEKPCDLCCKISAARDAESGKPADPVKPPAPPAAGKLLHEMLPVRIVSIDPPSPTDLLPLAFPGVNLSAGFPKATPPVPPPCCVA